MKKKNLEEDIKNLDMTEEECVREHGMDKRNYLIYKDMVDNTSKFVDEYLLLEMGERLQGIWHKFFK